MRRPALIALAVLTAAPAAACGDFLSSSDDDPPPSIRGSFAAEQLVPSGSGSDWLAQGWDVGITFLSGRYLIVRLPPDQEFAEPQISVGGFTSEDDDRISFSDEENQPLDAVQYTVEGPQGSEILQLDFDEGRLGFLQLRTAVADFGDIITAIGGNYAATEFVLTDAEGNRIDLVADPDADVSLAITAETSWPPLGGYQLNIKVPAGMLADTALDQTYPDDVNSSGFLGVGKSLVFAGLMGCELFAGGEPVLAEAISFRGYACDIAGKSYLVNAHFEPS